MKSLTEREAQVLYLKVECCLPWKTIARQLNCSSTAVQSCIRAIYHKLGVHSELELCRLYYLGERPCPVTSTSDGKVMVQAQTLPSGFLAPSTSCEWRSLKNSLRLLSE